MWVAVDGESYCKARVASGVPQGTVLGQLLFLLFISDLHSVVPPGTTTRLFADDCLVYREIKAGEDQVTLQRDLSALVTWAKIWGMQINPAKCNVMRIHRLQSPFLRTYDISGTTLAEVEQAKYLGITLSDKLDWEAQVDNIAKKASNTLNFLKRNLEYCPKQCKEVAYFALVRSTTEYGSVVWDPHSSKEKEKVERVNRRAARMVSNDGRQSSVTSMLTRLGWATLDQRLTMMYKVVHGLVAVPTTHLMQQIPAPEPTTVLSFGLSVVILRLTSIPSFHEPFLLGTFYQQKPLILRPSMHSSIVFRSSAFHLHRRDIHFGSLPITFQIQIHNVRLQISLATKLPKITKI